MPCGIKTSGDDNGVLQEFGYTYDNRPSPTSEWTTYSGTLYDRVVKVDYLFTHGHCIDKYHAKVAKGELIPHTPFLQTYRAGKLTYGAGKWSWTDGWSTFRDYTYLPGMYPAAGANYMFPDYAEIEDTLQQLNFDYNVQKAASKIYSSGTHDTLTFLAELGKTRDMFRNMLERVVRARSILKHPPKYRDLPLREWWLEARYGWRPLLYDIRDITEAVTTLDKSKERYFGRSMFEDSWVNSDTVTQEYSVNGTTPAWDQRQVITETWNTGTRGHVAADYVRKSNFQFNLVQTAWELTPYSFVTDWIVNTQQAIEALAFLALTTKYVASGGLYVRLERDITQTAINFKNGYSGNMEVSSNGIFEYKRRIPTRVPKTPQLKVRLNSFKVLDLIALAIGPNDRLSTRR